MFAVLVTYRRPRCLATMLARLVGQEDLPLERLVVVDNSPTDLTRDLVRAQEGGALSACYVAAPGNLGPAGGFALGMREALPATRSEDWILLLDDDDPPPAARPRFLSDLAAFASRIASVDPRAAAVGAGGFRFDARRGMLRRVPDAEMADVVPVHYIGSSMFPLYRVAAVREVGVFDDRLVFGFEDLEYGLRLGKAGYRLYAGGILWRERRRPRPPGRGRRRPPTPPWRRYYGVRNLVYILRSSGYPISAARAAILGGLARPLLNVLLRRETGGEAIRLGLRGARDGWAGRLGRSVEPLVSDTDKASREAAPETLRAF